MNDVAALTLLTRIEACWPNPRWTQVKQDMWREDLQTLEEGAAGTAFMQLRRSQEHCPTFAMFAGATKALKTTDGGSERFVCGYCDNTGWIDASLSIENHSVKPCGDCDEGVKTRATLQRHGLSGNRETDS